MKYPTKTQFLIGLLILVVIVLLLISFSSRKNTKSLVNRFSKEADDLGLDINKVIADTGNLYTEFGKDVFWNDWIPFKVPAPWENEEGIIRISNMYPSPTLFNFLAKVYDNRFKGSLRDDIYTYLTPAQQARIPQL